MSVVRYVLHESLYGLAAGLLFIVASTLTVGAVFLGVPAPVSLLGNVGDVTGRVIAPAIGEELLFRELLFEGVLRGLMPLPVAIVAQAVAFAGMHLSVYSNIAGSGALIGAGIFAVMAAGLTLYRGNVIPAMVFHAVVNLFIIYGHFLTGG